MTTECEDKDFISSLPRIPIAQLPITQSVQEVPASPAVWFAVDETNNVWYVGEAENLRNSLPSRHPKIKTFKENGVSSIAYWVVEEKQESLAKEAKKKHNPPLNQNKSDIFVPAINSFVKNTGLPKKEIIRNSDIGENFLNDLGKKNRGIVTSKLEDILLSDCVTKDIFKEFILEIIRLWKFYKEYPDDVTLEEAVLAVLDDSEEKKTMR